MTMLKSKWSRGLLVLLAVLFLGMAANHAQAAGAEKVLVLGGGGITGHYYLAGGAIAGVVNRYAGEVGGEKLRVAVNPSPRASGENVEGVASGTFNLGLVQSDVQAFAYGGTGAYEKTGPQKGLRALFSLYSEVFTVVTKDADIRSFADLAGRRVSMGNPGASYRTLAEMLMGEYKMAPNSIEAVENMSPADAVQAVANGQLDAMIYVIGHPFEQLVGASASGARILPVEGKESQALMAKHPYYIPATIPTNAYKGMTDEVRSFGPVATLVANEKMSDDAAYAIVKAVFENLEELKKSHPILAPLTKEGMIAGNTAPLHNGALRYYKEAGLIR